MSADRHNATRPDGYLLVKNRMQGKTVSWADVVFSCEYKLKDGDKHLDDVRVHQGLWGAVVCLSVVLGRAHVHMGHATCYARRSVSPSYI